MKNTPYKRVTSFLLALTLALGTSPMAALATAEETETIPTQEIARIIEADEVDEVEAVDETAIDTLEADILDESDVKNITIGLGADESERIFTWYDSAETSYITINTTKYDATQVASSDTSYYGYTVTIDVVDETTYTYTVGTDSTEYTYKTADTSDGDYSFLAAGDPQIGSSNATSDGAGWTTSLTHMSNWFDMDSFDFLITLGDQINGTSRSPENAISATELEWDNYFANGFLSSLPNVMNVGNHENYGYTNYSAHYTAPSSVDENTITSNSGDQSGDYWYAYESTLFMVLNSNDASNASHISFMEQAIEDFEEQEGTAPTWQIVTFHHSIYSSASHYADSQVLNLRYDLADAFSELNIDAVLMGHDHVYTRTVMMQGQNPTEEANIEEPATSVTDPKAGEVVYFTLNSGSGSKYYSIQNVVLDYTAVKIQEETPNMTVVDVTDTELTFTTYKTDTNNVKTDVVDTFTIERTSAYASNEKPTGDYVQVQQVYGGDDDGRVSHGFIELYNPTASDVVLDGMTLQYRSSVDGGDTAWSALELTGTIEAGDYFVVRCAEMTDFGDVGYYITDADMDWDIMLHNKGVSVALVDGIETITVEGAVSTTELATASIIDMAATAGNDYKDTKYVDNATQVAYAYESADDSEWGEVAGLQSKKNAVYRTQDTDNSNADFIAIDYSSDTISEYLPHCTVSTTAPDVVVSDITEYSAVELETVLGYENSTNGGLDVEMISRFDTGLADEDGGLIEIVTYNTEATMAYAVAGSIGELIVIDMSELSLAGLAGTGYNMEALLADSDMGTFTYGDMSSVAVNEDGTLLAVAIQEADYTANGLVAIFELNEDGTLSENIEFVDCGVQSDMLTFTPDGTMILVANEGEPREGYTATGAVDPEGSVTIITVGETYTSEKASFEGVTYDSNVLLKTGSTPQADFEPEYIATTDTTAYVALQENNAIAVLDLATKAFTGVYGLGLQDFGTVALDMVADEEINITTQNNVYGIRMPDGISLYTIDGVDYLFTANEGDGREWGDGDDEYVNENKDTTSYNGTEYAEKVTWFNPADYTMLDQDKDYLFGTRSFSIFAVTGTGLELVFDSESDFETLTADYVTENFNCSNDNISLEDRSGKKGVEPEYAMVGEVDGSIYAFIGLERLGGVMVYDVTDPADAEYVNYINTRNYDTDIAGDVAPEGMAFVSANDSPTGEALLLVANEVSGTMPVYELTSYTKSNTSGGTSTPSVNTSASSSDDETEEETVAEEETSTSSASDFSDVDSSDWFYDSVEFALENGLFTGTSDDEFSPNGEMTRNMFFTLLHRMSGDTDVTGGTQWYEDGASWAVLEGISDGTNGDSEVTREQLVTMLWRYANEPSATADTAAYSDADTISDWASDAMDWAVSVGLMTGRTDTEIVPTGLASRAEVATLIMRFLAL